MMEQMTFRKLDGNIHYRDPQSALELWYERVRDVAIESLGVGDLCVAMRQNVHLNAVVPIALSKCE